MYNDSCPICLLSFCHYQGYTKITSCRHKYCELCLEEWLRDNVTCPVCRSVLREKTKEEKEREEIRTEFDEGGPDDEDTIWPERIYLNIERPEMELTWLFIKVLGTTEITIHGVIDEPIHPNFPESQKVMVSFQAESDHALIGEHRWNDADMEETLYRIREIKQNQVMDLKNGTNLSINNPQLNIAGITVSSLDIPHLSNGEWFEIPVQ